MRWTLKVIMMETPCAKLDEGKIMTWDPHSPYSRLLVRMKSFFRKGGSSKTSTMTNKQSSRSHEDPKHSVRPTHCVTNAPTTSRLDLAPVTCLLVPVLARLFLLPSVVVTEHPLGFNQHQVNYHLIRFLKSPHSFSWWIRIFPAVQAFGDS